MNKLLRGFLIDRRSSGATEMTIRWHKSAIGKCLSWLEGHGYAPDDPETWSPAMLREYILHLQESTSIHGRPLSESSVTTYTSSMLAFCRWLFEEEYLSRDITKRVKKPRPPQEQKTPYSADDLHGMLNAAKKTTHAHRDYAILCVLIDCGLRAQELCDLTVDDVNFEQMLIKVRQGKGRKDRMVPCSSVAAKAILRYMSKVRENYDDVPDYLFLSETYSKLSPNGLLQLVQRLAKRAGVSDAYPHRFRHTFALNYLRNSGDALSLQRIMGHTTLAMTNRYVNMMTDDLQRVHKAASPLAHLLK